MRTLTALLITLLIAGTITTLCTLTLKPADAQSLPTPAVPQFTLRFFDSSYDIPAVTSTDSFTGQQITTPSRHIEQRTIEVKIKNTSVQSQVRDVNVTNQAGILYNIRWKPHYALEKEWLTLFGHEEYLPQIIATETLHNINMTVLNDGRLDVPAWSQYIPNDAQLDFQVQAMVGGPNNAWTFLGQKSDWSNTQTITIGVTPNSASPTPDIPEFTLNLLNSSYNIQSTTTTDPFTGQQTFNPVSHVEARTIEIRIKNEPFTQFSVKEGTSNWTVGFFYNIRWKGHFEESWNEIYNPSDGYLARDLGSETVYSNQGEYSSKEGLKLNSRGIYLTFPIGAEVDFQVEAMIGYTHRVVEGGDAPWHFFGETSGWTNTQTLTITDKASAPFFGLGWLGVAAVVVVVVVLLITAAVFLVRRRRN
jgi:hypothetical protein